MPISFAVGPVRSRRQLQYCLDALVACNLGYPDVPPLDSVRGVRYQRERRGREVWQSCYVTHRLGQGDCEDLACWLVRDYRLRGIRARAVPVRQPSGGWHIVVTLPDGSTRDPSRERGM